MGKYFTVFAVVELNLPRKMGRRRDENDRHLGKISAIAYLIFYCEDTESIIGAVEQKRERESNSP